MEYEGILHKRMDSLGAPAYKKFLYTEVIYRWRDLFDESICDKVMPVKIEHGVLFVNVKNSALKDQLKFMAEEIIDSINEKFGRGKTLIKEIKIARGFQIANMPIKENSQPAQIQEKKFTLQDMILSEEEVKHCEERAQEISDEELRKTVLQTLLSHARFRKLRVANGWHKCLKCDSLCAPEDIFCEVCKIKERETMLNTLFDILFDAPQLKSWEVQKILLEKIPYMKNECSLDVIESARTSLIQKIASSVSFGDEESPNALKLVALEKRLPLDELTPAIIQRALIDLQFNLADQQKVQRYVSLKNKKQSSQQWR